MTNKEAIEELKRVDTLDMPARLCEAHYMAIKALEQEPKTDVLDKIRAEIDSHCSDNRDRNDGLYIAMKIIDKHIKEIEDLGDYPDEIPNQFDNLTGSMNI